MNLASLSLGGTGPQSPRHEAESATRALSSTFSSPEPDVQRGRKRQRSPAPLSFIVSAHTQSGESATFRGRRRFRSTSMINISSRNPSRSLRGASASPSTKRLLRIVRLDRRRSQSPSRSRSPFNLQDVPKRRRHRTRSHSRTHQDNSVASPDLKSPLQFEFHADQKTPGKPDKL
jgi:hypothetical protein